MRTNIYVCVTAVKSTLLEMCLNELSFLLSYITSREQKTD